jgi:pseudaminic acid biosynthesis-associated methylase
MGQNNYFTEQEAFWAGEFGDDYIGRNKGENKVASNIMFFSKILLRIGSIESVIEFGANIGLNLLAMKQLLPSAKFAAIEINDKAARELKHIQGVDVYQDSILNFTPPKKYELVLAKGVLIHIAPDRLTDVYERLYQAYSKFILLAEYYNPTPVEVSYRGHKEKLFKRDFAGEMLDRFPQLRLLDYGFVYHRDSFPQDDMTWFLMEK